MPTIPEDEITMAKIQSVKARYEADLLQKPHVVGVGIGLRTQEGQPVGEPGLIVNVSRRVPALFQRPKDRIPKVLDGVPVWIEVIGEVKAQG
ncbi:MAG TPA: hypothetical protein PKZ84_01295 [Anaerolineae bacterium]|nr:hypothetical protein [Anaerolineae bacterium]HQI83033.1 hypothetical protein [Anaerolineae bacterium]